MIILNFFRFSLETINGKQSLFNPEDFGEEPLHYTDEYECLTSFFDVPQKSMSLYATKLTNTGDRAAYEPEAYKCDILSIKDGIILFTIENNRIKHTIVDKQDIENPHHPYTRVIIDSRPNRHIMAIERNSAFGPTPQKIIDILKEGIDHLIGRYQMEIKFVELQKSRTDFWATINDLRSQFKDTVKQIRIDFLGKTNNPSSNDILRLLSAIAHKAECDGSILLSGSNEGDVNIDEIRADLEAIANICLAQPAYCLAVRFKNFGLYRYGAGVAAQFELDEKTLDDFSCGTTIMSFNDNAPTFALTEWLDKINSLLIGYEENTIVYSGRTTRNRR